MTQEEKMKRLLDAQDHPETFTEEELQAMLKEDDLRESAELMARLKQAYIGKETEDIDVDAEWQRFASQKPKRRSWGWMQIAAAFIGLLLVSGIAIAAVHIVRHYQKPEAPQVADTTAVANSSAFTHHSSFKKEAGPVVFDNVTLDSIAKDIAAYHHLEMNLQNGQAGELRFYFVWNQDESLQEVIEKLNMFEQVNLAVEDRKLIVR